ncbi:hypothetical protein EWM64_g8606 [Hericium alpestre]|uniref:Uncharacterized protein n=1 Tax=Hericium alpestre TaxID=135208 RepID=A0A4Y9ZKR8_9AGAM|nr:hypothetical protein EWM64_g8606 [Hericium alpestre]
MLNMARKIGTAIQKAANYRHFVMAITEKNVPRVQAIVQTALRNGASISAIVCKIRSSVEGLYHPANFTTSDMDVSTLIYHTGGHALLYAMSQCSGIPSLRTLRNHTVFTRVMPTIGHITQKEIDHNIREVIVKALEDKDMTSSQVPVTPCSMSLLIDEVALKESAVHFWHTNSIGGLCWKHSNAVDLVLCTFQSAVNIAQGLANGSVHMGKEMTITSLLFFGLDRTFPVLAALTCKQETAEDMQFILELILKTWKDSSGIKDANGMYLLIVTSAILECYLIMFKGETVETVKRLLNPKDLQDVPHAIELMQMVISLGTCNVETNHPSIVANMDAIRYLAALLEAILEPFININLSLQEQIIRLSKFVHLSFACFRLY